MMVIEPTQNRMLAETKPSVKRPPAFLPRSILFFIKSPAPSIPSSIFMSVPSTVPKTMQMIRHSVSFEPTALTMPITIVTSARADMMISIYDCFILLRHKMPIILPSSTVHILTITAIITFVFLLIAKLKSGSP